MKNNKNWIFGLTLSLFSLTAQGESFSNDISLFNFHVPIDVADLDESITHVGAACIVRERANSPQNTAWGSQRMAVANGRANGVVVVTTRNMTRGLDPKDAHWYRCIMTLYTAQSRADLRNDLLPGNPDWSQADPDREAVTHIESAF